MLSKITAKFAICIVSIALSTGPVLAQSGIVKKDPARKLAIEKEVSGTTYRFPVGRNIQGTARFWIGLYMAPNKKFYSLAVITDNKNKIQKIATKTQNFWLVSYVFKYKDYVVCLTKNTSCKTIEEYRKLKVGDGDLYGLVSGDRAQAARKIVN
jgi:hypothetical protein